MSDEANNSGEAKRMVATRFYSITQNNSGGSFDHNPEAGIGYAVCVEAVDADHAAGRLRRTTDNYKGRGGDCPCCGDRWDIFLYEEDGTDAPTLYGEPLTGSSAFPSYIHYLDGSIEARCSGDKA